MSGPEYLFIRILEACNADCCMCAFARSRDRFRFAVADLRAMLGPARLDGIRYVRFTGGEPLLHAEIVNLVRAVNEVGMKCSLITNGSLLVRLLPRLAEAGLRHVIVSIDGLEVTHDEMRGTHGLYRRAMAGLVAAHHAGLTTRVNTVCSPSNFREMPALQRILQDAGVDQWELSSLKLERPLDWSAADQADLDAVVQQVYTRGRQPGRLVPMGKVWCGETEPERERYLATGSTPRPDGVCRVVDKVRYLDARGGMLYPCSLLPHRPDAQLTGVRVGALESARVNGERIRAQARRFRVEGPGCCTGCSTTAAGYSNAFGTGTDPGEWAY